MMKGATPVEKVRDEEMGDQPDNNTATTRLERGPHVQFPGAFSISTTASDDDRQPGVYFVRGSMGGREEEESSEEEEDGPPSPTLVVVEAQPVDEAAEAERDRLFRQLQEERASRELHVRQLENRLQAKKDARTAIDKTARGNNRHRWGTALVLVMIATGVALGVGLSRRKVADSGAGDRDIWVQKGQPLYGSAAGDWFGISVDLSADSDTLVAGSSLANNTGHVRVFVYNHTSRKWIQRGLDVRWDDSSQNEDGAFGGGVALSAIGHRLAAGYFWIGHNDPGHIRVLQYDETTKEWMQVGQTLDGESAEDLFGWSVALSSEGTVLAGGAIWNDENGTSSGQVRIFGYNVTTDQWGQLGQNLLGHAPHDNFGYSIDLSADGSIVAGGSWLNSGNGSNVGCVRVLQYNQATSLWEALGQTLLGEVADGRFGISVALSAEGAILAVGSQRNGSNGPHAGSLRVFQYNSLSNQWSQLGQTLEGDAGDEFGTSVALSACPNVHNCTVAAGALYNDGAATDAGRTAVFRFDSNTQRWKQIGRGVNGEKAGDRFGNSIALSADGGTVASGGYFNGDVAKEAGHVRVFVAPTEKAR